MYSTVLYRWKQRTCTVQSCTGEHNVHVQYNVVQVNTMYMYSTGGQNVNTMYIYSTDGQGVNTMYMYSTGGQGVNTMYMYSTGGQEVNTISFELTAVRRHCHDDRYSTPLNSSKYDQR